MDGPLRPYVSDLLAGWPADAEDTKELSGAFMFADISGFTALSEALGDRGREGAELLNRTVTEVLTGFIAAARRRGGDILAFGGDAILVHFDGSDPVLRAVVAAQEMQRSLDVPVSVEGVGEVQLAVSIGVHTGEAPALRLSVGTQTEAVVLGPTITRTLRAEGEAKAGQILLTHDAAERLPESCLGERIGRSVLAGSVPLDGTEGEPAPDPVAATVDVRHLLAPAVAAVAGTLDAEGQHRRVAVGFVRIARTDELVAELGPREALRQISEVTEVLAEQAALAGVHVLTVDAYPDAVKMLLCAGAPVATDDNEGALLHALSEAVARLPGRNVHVGAHRGLAFAGDLGATRRRGYTLLGDTVNLAARLMQRAAPGEVLATDALIERTDIPGRQLPPFKVKGKTEDVRAFRVGSGDEQHSGVDLPLVGRSAEVARLDAIAASVLAGRRAAIDVAGPGGVGKSRLLRETVNRNPELEPFVGRATSYASSTPYGLARRLLRVLLRIPRQLPSDEAGHWLMRLVSTAAPDLLHDAPLIANAIDATVAVATPDLPTDSAVVQRRTARAVSQLLRAVRLDPMLVIVDDAQWMDEASRQIVRRLVDDNPDRPWMLVALRRTGATPVFESMTEVIDMDLPPLGRTDAESLVRAAAGDRPLFDDDVDTVVKRADGNCLFLVEYARSPDGDVPDDVETLIRRRIDALEPESRRLLGVAAVVGTHVDLEVATGAALEVDGDAPSADDWGRLGAFLDAERSGSVAWRDVVHRDVVYAALPFERRRNLHRAVYRAIERAPSDGSLARAVALATHADLGRMAAEAWEMLRKTGERAVLDGASVDAVSLLSRATAWADELGAEVDDGTRLETLQSLGLAAEVAGRLSEGVAAMNRALDIDTDVPTRVTLLSMRSRLLMMLGEMDEAREAVARGQELVGDRTGLDGAVSHLLLARASIEYRLGDHEAGLETVREIVRLDTGLVSPLVRARAFLIGDGITAEGGSREWMVGRGLSLFSVLGDDYGVGSAENNVGMVAYREGDWERAVEHWKRGAEAHVRAGASFGLAGVRMNIAEILSDQGSWADSLEVMSSARNTFRAGNYRLALAFVTSLIGRTTARLGDHEVALAELADAEQAFREVGAGDMADEALVRRAEAAWLAGDASTLRSILDGIDTMPGHLRASVALMRWVASTLEGNDADDAELVRAAEMASDDKRWYDYLMAHVLRAGARGVDVTEDVDVRALAHRLGVWRVATDIGEIRLGPPPADEGDRQSVDQNV